MLKELLQQKAEIEASMAELKERLDFVMGEISNKMSDSISVIREKQAKEFGAVNVVADGIKVTQTIPKKVTWDQDKLLDLYGKIMFAGDKPGNYMKINLEIPEKLYDAFGDEVKSIFATARTVKPGNPTWKFEEVTNA